MFGGFSGKKIALYGMLISLAMILSYVESVIPAFYAVPGMKLGLSNVVVLFTMYKLDEKSAFFINVIRIILVGILFGSGISIWYSLAGGTLSFSIMLVLKQIVKVKLITVSIAGGVFHNIGQILVAMFLLNTYSIMYYMGFLWLSGVITGAVIGIISYEIVKRVEYNE